MKSPEWHEKKAIKDYLNGGGPDNPNIWYFMPYMAGRGKNGVSDIVGCYKFKGMFVIEVKRPNGVPTAIQWRRMREVEAAGGKAFWGWSEKVIPEFEAWIS